MIRADRKDKELIVNILAECFNYNKSVNYIVKQDSKRSERIKKLMEFSFDICYLYGDVFLSEDKKGCALLLMPDKKKTTLKSLLLNARLVISCISILNLKKVMAREAAIKKAYPNAPMYYLWFIGVAASEQNKGVGTRLLQEIIQEGSSKQRPVYLETSSLKNIPWYKKFGFTIYKKHDFGYELFCMKKEWIE